MTEKLKTVSAPSDETDAELLLLIEDIGCLCGIPGCKGHEDKGGYIELTRVELELLERARRNESDSHSG